MGYKGEINMSEENTNVNDEITENTTNEEQENTTFTQSEVDSQISKAVAKALENGKAKWEQKKQEELEQAKNEAAEYAKMTEKEKAEAEYNKRLEELEKREKELNNRQLLSEIQSDLQANELPKELAETLLSLQDNEKIKQQIDSIKKHIDDVVNNRVKETLRQGTPNESTAEITNDPFTQRLQKYNK